MTDPQDHPMTPAEVVAQLARDLGLPADAPPHLVLAKARRAIVVAFPLHYPVQRFKCVTALCNNRVIREAETTADITRACPRCQKVYRTRQSREEPGS